MLQLALPLALWAACCQAAAQPSVVINEIHYNPDVKTELVEFVELFNAATNAADLSGWYFSDGISFTFPAGTLLPAGGYLVVAQDPAALRAKFGVSALGPWTGQLDNDGETITLHDAAGRVVDQVDYQLGFPWPTVGDPPGYSIELVNPAFDNDLGGHWRASVAGTPSQQSVTLVPDHSSWKYFKGTSEASTPTTAWRALAFNDSAWLVGVGPIGYGEGADFLRTVLDDMRYNYSTVFFRKTFVVSDPGQITALTLEAVYDDGFKLWLNGSNVLNANIAAGEVPYTGTANTALEDLTYRTFNLDAYRTLLVAGTNILAVQAANASLSGSSDFFFDARLLASTGPSARGPTPGALNSVYAANLPPAIRQVDHSPNQPRSGQPILITAKATDPEGVTNVTLLYQLVDPGNYIELTNAAYTNTWTVLSMNDSGQNGDAHAGDAVYSVTLPGNLALHRRLIRYRIRASDATGQTLTVPYPDDPQPNFALFCYDGVPAWRGAVRPGVTPVLDFDTNVMGRLPVVHLIARSNTVAQATWFSRYAGDAYPWLGTLVYDGKVYDHVHYRARGGVWRYAMVKNMWKFDLNRGHELAMRDDYGRHYKTRWAKLNLGACIQQGDYGHRGEQGMFEAVGFRLFNLAGVQSPYTTFLHFRVIDDALEADPTTQYEGDFWGLYLAVEQEGGRFLDEHDLPDGNLYKMEGGTGELNNLGPLGPTDKSDLNAFLSTYRSTAPAPSEAWWRTNLLLHNYWSYQAIVQGIHHYDICYGKNYFYFRNPQTGLWSVHTWDLDLTWADNMFDSGCGGVDDLYKPVLGDGGSYPVKPAMIVEYKNRLREIRDLLFNTDQTWQLIDEYAALLRGPTNTLTFLDADRCMWDYNPKMINSAYSSALNKAGQGRFYQWPNEPGVSKDFNGCIQLMKSYVVTRGARLDSLASDTIPATPTLTNLSAPNFPLNRLSFRCSPYSGSQPFAAMQWRVAEVTDTNAPAYDPAGPRPYEINAVWETGEQPVFQSDLTLPAAALKVGHAYRIRARMKDVTGRCSHWSAPIQFIVTPPDNAAALVDHLRITELMYDPPAGSAFEFVELCNRSADLTLNLEGVKFTAGIDFSFPAGALLPPGGYLLVIKNADFAAFRAHYGLSTNVPLYGPYSGSLANEGETLELKAGAAGVSLAAFTYSNGRGWPLAAAGAGHSLVPLDCAHNGPATGALDYGANWRASVFVGGSPGTADPELPPPTVVLNEIAAHTDYANPAKPEYDSNDWIELFNRGDAPVNLAGWYLSDDPANPRKWAIPACVLPPGGRLSFDEVTGFHSPITTGFGLDKAGEQVLLSYLPGTAADRVVDAVKFKGQENEAALGRFPDGGADWMTLPRTRDAANVAPLPHLVITELMYHPPDNGTNDNTSDEFVELFNPTATTVSLSDTNGAWRLDGGVSFTFPAGVSLPPGGLALVVNFNPADAEALAGFRARYTVTNPAVPVFGPYGGKLGNRGDRVALEKPQYPDLPGDSYSWVVVDEVFYGNQTPWPASANGGGFSLHRTVLTGSGNNPRLWFAAPPSPGQPSTTDRDSDGLPDEWEWVSSFDPDNPADAAADADGDGSCNVQEYLAGTDPRDPLSVLKFVEVTADGEGVWLRFPVVAGRSYTVQVRASLLTPWLKLQDVAPWPTNGVARLLDAAATNASQRFYRVVTPAVP